MTTNTLPIERTEPSVFREALTTLRGQIRSDATEIRAAKQTLRRLQKENHPDAAYQQSRLAALRQDNRARQLISGLLRGRTWAQMESNHPEGDARLSYRLRKAWTALSTQFPQVMPPALQEFLA